MNASQGSRPAVGRRHEGRDGELLEALRAQPGGPQLLALARERHDIALVGGAVRDLLRGCAPRELDVVVARDAARAAGELAERLGASTVVHERFGTAVVEWHAGRIDIAARRAETYAAPGALPDVRPGTVEQDLRRRDFTVNAIAIPLAGPHAGEPLGAEHALEDLHARRLRVLHERSFIEDPTRLLRLARYGVRLRFQVEPHTAELARAALDRGALATVSRTRVGAELRLALGEADAPAVLERMDELGVLAALDPRLGFDAALARAGLELLAAADTRGGTGREQARPDLLLLIVLLHSLSRRLDERTEIDMRSLMDDLEFPGADRDLAVREALRLEGHAESLAHAEAPSDLHQAVAGVSPEGVALAGAWGDLRWESDDAGRAAREWLAELRNVRLLISGEDLLAAGVPQGPEVGLRLQAALLRKLDGDLREGGRQAELTAALAARV